jgi:hypothetical protein
MQRILEDTGMDVLMQRKRHSFQSMYWFLRCTFGLPREHFLPVRTFWRFINWYHARRIKLLERIEATLNPIMGKDMILYGFRRARPSPTDNGVAATAGTREG